MGIGIGGTLQLGGIYYFGATDFDRGRPESGTIYNDNNARVAVNTRNAAWSANPNIPGNVTFDYRGRTFYDEGFDGTVDLIRFQRANDEGQFKEVILTPSDAEFKDHLPLYLEARNIVTRNRK